MILNLVPNQENFRTTLRAVRHWAKSTAFAFSFGSVPYFFLVFDHGALFASLSVQSAGYIRTSSDFLVVSPGPF